MYLSRLYSTIKITVSALNVIEVHEKHQAVVLLETSNYRNCEGWECERYAEELHHIQKHQIKQIKWCIKS